MTTQFEAAIVRIWSADKRVVGAGVLITDTLILTCAHVVAQALEISDGTPEMPAGELMLDFPLADPGTWVTAQVSQWLPVQPDGSGDLACLELQGSLPKDAQPVPLMAAADLWEHPLRAFGFPAAHDNGVWASGVLRAKQANAWIQIEDVKQTGYFIEPGFSGTPVWDDEVQGVVGITVAAERQRDVRAAFVIPVPAIIGSFPDLKHVVRAAPPPTKKAGGDSIAARVGDVSGGSQVAIGKEIQQNITIHKYGELPASVDPAPLREAYLNQLFETCGQVFLIGIDRKAAGQKTEACLKLSGIYTALLTQSTEHPEREFPSREGLGVGSFPSREGPWVGSFLSREGVGVGSQERRSSAVEQLNQHKRLVILGDPGSGKSTFVNFVTLCLAGEHLGNPHANLKLLTAPLPKEKEKDEEKPQPWDHGVLLPVRVILRDFAAEGLPPAGQQAKAIHLWEFLVNTLKETPFGEYSPFLHQHLLKSGGLVLLDGLDEVPEAHSRRTQIKEAVEDFARSFPKCRVVVTSRTYAYQQQDWQLTDFAKVVLAPFTPGQIIRFVDQWYQQSADLLGMRPDDAKGRAELLKRAIFGSDRLHDFARRPLLLTLMASLHAWRGGSLPEKREELYNDAVELLLDWWESRKVKDHEGQFLSLTEVLKLGREGMNGLRSLISSLAYDAHASQPDLVGTADIQEDKLAGGLLRLSQDKDVNPLRLVEYLRDRAGLLIAHGVGVYTFPHRTFQEYLAACCLTDDQNNYPDNVAELARNDPDRWREVVLLAGAKAARGAASTIWFLIEALCWREKNLPNVETADAWGALLAGQTLLETANIEQVSERHRLKVDRIRDWLVALLTEQQPADAPFPAVERALAGNILAVLGDPRPGVRLRSDGLPDIEWCEVPEGEFLMGSDPKKDSEAINDEQPQHKVTLSAYQISRYLVTNAQYQTFVEDGGYTEQWQQCWIEDGWEWKEANRITGPEHYGGAFDLPNHPVVGISWYEAMAFCQWLMLRLRESGELLAHQEIRLPTEAQWEKAARSTDGRVYPWGDEITPEHANYVDTGLGTTSTVGCFPRGTSPYGCEDLSGNVYEWCLDRCDRDDNYNIVTDTYKDGVIDPVCLSGSARVPRGGYWILVARLVRAAYRYGLSPGRRVFGIGFRLVRTPS